MRRDSNGTEVLQQTQTLGMEREGWMGIGNVATGSASAVGLAEVRTSVTAVAYIAGEQV